MPKQYEAIRDQCVKKGRSLKSCKTSAAKIYNSLHPDNPNPWAKEMHPQFQQKHHRAKHQ